jgi:hypothetical protein
MTASFTGADVEPIHSYRNVVKNISVEPSPGEPTPIVFVDNPGNQRIVFSLKTGSLNFAG